MNVPEHRKYGLTEAEAEALFHGQAGLCAICRKRFRPGRPAQVDHVHETGMVRGLLCHYCNWTLGQLHEDRGWLRRAADYLDKPPSERLLERIVYTPNSPGAAGLVTTPKDPTT